MTSLAQRFWNLNARGFEKQVLRLVTNQAALRRLYDRLAPISYRRLKDMRFAPALIEAGGFTARGRWCTRGEGAQAGLLFYIHGGGFCIGSPKTHGRLVAALAGAAGLKGLAVAYRLAPEHPFPAAIEDVVEAYQAVLAAGWLPERIVIAGDSAGGNLALSLLTEAKRLGLPRPAGCMAIAPAVDLSGESPSLRENAASEMLLPEKWLGIALDGYLAGADPKDPRASPLFGDFEGAGPVFLTVGAGELFRDESRRMRDALQAQGVAVTYEEVPDVHHVWHLRFGQSPEADAAVARMGTFARACLPGGGAPD
ncbi:alpha/beta hydrolase [Pseudoruegeria sp. SHC-113]|uniref:alpha/beta hydrolase n=1 Tax=Pseudoruegeria sp. SHC-113 TaxID=2855439 RepID=UPI0021BB33DF|nr:alpha/beta hydrolase [Pseudoruegeria sp. SHC-113]MCT8161503.1 alpha/beta hydrolase [Pseudoruegeria sp. SHC-113]